MQRRSPFIAIIGAGMGGLAAAATLRQAGINATVYQQAPHSSASVSYPLPVTQDGATDEGP